jgi:hypothetical protein
MKNQKNTVEMYIIDTKNLKGKLHYPVFVNNWEGSVNLIK